MKRALLVIVVLLVLGTIVNALVVAALGASVSVLGDYGQESRSFVGDAFWQVSIHREFGSRFAWDLKQNRDITPVHVSHGVPIPWWYPLAPPDGDFDSPRFFHHRWLDVRGWPLPCSWAQVESEL